MNLPYTPVPRVATEADAYGLLVLLRLMERSGKGKPRIGKNATLRDEIVTIGQDPYLAFPESDVSNIDRSGKRTQVRSRVLGLFGPQGALPLNTTEEVLRWFEQGDHAFIRFTDIFATRFQQLFFRAWSDSRAITQFDHETGDRFRVYIEALMGLGTPAFRNRDALPDINKDALAAIAIGRVKSPRRLQQMLRLDLGLRAVVEEHQLSWIELEDDSHNRLGQRGSSLGRNMYLGARVASVNEKIRLRVPTRTIAEYRSLLPGGASHRRMRDIVRWYLGQSVEVDVALSLPAAEMPSAVVGASTQLGWVASLAPDRTQDQRRQVPGAQYALELNAAA